MLICDCKEIVLHVDRENSLLVTYKDQVHKIWSIEKVSLDSPPAPTVQPEEPAETVGETGGGKKSKKKKDRRSEGSTAGGSRLSLGSISIGFSPSTRQDALASALGLASGGSSLLAIHNNSGSPPSPKSSIGGGMEEHPIRSVDLLIF